MKMSFTRTCLSITEMTIMRTSQITTRSCSFITGTYSIITRTATVMLIASLTGTFLMLEICIICSLRLPITCSRIGTGVEAVDTCLSVGICTKVVRLSGIVSLSCSRRAPVISCCLKWKLHHLNDPTFSGHQDFITQLSCITLLSSNIKYLNKSDYFIKANKETLSE